MSYTKRANEYIQKVLKGKIKACKYVRQACQRQHNDLKRWNTKQSFYHFDTEAAERICKFIETLPHIKGEWAKQRENLKLQDWQIFILTTAFGWKDQNDLRRFKRVYVEVPRKNGKTTFAAPVGLYMLAADKEQGAEIYSAATNRDQAKIVFQVAREMARRKRAFTTHFGVNVFAHNLHNITTASKFEPLSADANSLDGLNVHCAIIDELHAHKTRQVFDVVETSMGSRAQPMLWSITTAGANQIGICYEQRQYIVRILDKVIEDENYFGIIYTIDESDDWKLESSWMKANPNYGISVYPDDMKALFKKALESSQAQNAFKTKRLNVWVNANEAFMNMEAWHQCGDSDLTLDDFAGQDCYIGLDLASKIDVASKVYLFKRDGLTHIFSKHYLPDEYVDSEMQAKTAHYKGWSMDGHLELTPGNMIDFDIIETDLKNDMAIFNVIEIGYDPWQAAMMVAHMMEAGAPMTEVRPSVMNFSDSMKMFEAMVLAKQVRHNKNPVLTWMLSNVICHLDAKDNIFPRKEKPENKIDGFIALITALNRQLASEGDGKSVYEERGIAEIEM